MSETVTEKRVYTKRVRTFDAIAISKIVKSYKEVGVVETAKRFNTLPIYVSEVLAGRGIEVKRGRKAGQKAAEAVAA